MNEVVWAILAEVIPTHRIETHKHDGGKASSQLLEDMAYLSAFLSAQASPKRCYGAGSQTLSRQCSQTCLLDACL